MSEPTELLQQDKTKELWQKYCGFIDLSIEQFMTIQRRQLLEQLELLKRCELGSKVMRGAEPSTVEEFRQQVPLTTYDDYAPYLLEKREDVLPEKPIFWQRTSGRSGEYPFKWIPVTKGMYQGIGEALLTALILATCKRKGVIALREHDKCLYALAPPPYTSGSMARVIAQLFPFDFLPPLDEAEKMTFEERMQQSLKLALSDGIDLLGGPSSVLFAFGEQFSQGIRNGNMLPLLSKPRALFRLGKALLKSKLARRPILPKDLWSLKGIAGGGPDTFYKEKVNEMWGSYPLDLYVCSEAVIVAVQTWDRRGMTFLPYLSLLEFIPTGEYFRWKADPAYQPSTHLLDEVKPGQTYVVVITNFHGGPFVRYIIGDMIEITSLRNEELNIDIPQMVFSTRVDNLIDIASFTRLSEKTIRQAMENSGVAYEDWVVKKEAKEKPVLNLYLELKGNADRRDEEQLAAAIHEQLRKLDGDYADLESMIGLKPLKVTLLPDGAFRRYMLQQRANGADPVYLKPSHINPSDDVLTALLNSAHPR